jgi:hypothetical protein
MKNNSLVTYSTYSLYLIYDTLLYRALYPIIKSTSILDNYLIVLLGYSSLNFRRKIAVPDFPSLVYKYLISTDCDYKFDLLVQMKIDRIFLLKFLSLFLDEAKNINNDVNTKYFKYKIIDIGSFHSCVEDVNYWYSGVIMCRNDIASKYYDFAKNSALRFSKKNPNISIDDLTSEYLLTVYKAIDKLDPDKGTLTSYIGQWFRDVNSSNRREFEYNIAYNVPGTHRRKIAKKEVPPNIYHPLDIEDKTENI